MRDGIFKVRNDKLNCRCVSGQCDLSDTGYQCVPIDAPAPAPKTDAKLNAALIDGNHSEVKAIVDRMVSKLDKVKPYQKREYKPRDKVLRDENGFYYVNRGKREESLFTDDGKQNYTDNMVLAKEGTVNDPAKIAEMKLIGTILNEHEIALRKKTDIRNIQAGIAWLSNPVFDGPLAKGNVFLSVEYRTAAIAARLANRDRPLTTTIALRNLEALGNRSSDTRTMQEILDAVPDADYAADDAETMWLFFEQTTIPS